MWVDQSRSFTVKVLPVFPQYLGRGVVQYSIDVNFTLTILPQRDSYFHHTVVAAQVFNACKSFHLF